VNASYRVGLTIVAAMIALGAGLAPLVPPPANRAAEDLGGAGPTLGAFRLVDQSSQPATDAELVDRVWVAAFTFTRCPTSCPRISDVLGGLQAKLAGTGVRLVSLSVDPEYDTPGVLARYAKRFGADPSRWRLLTGPKDQMYDLIGRFGLGEPRADPAGAKEGAEAISHSARLALVDRGNRVVGYFDSDDPAAVARLVAKVRQKDRAWVMMLPAVNATLNGTCALLLAAGWVLIRRGRMRGHVACMTSGVAVSAVFLACYLVYHAQVGSVPFRGTGPIRLAYFTVLISHTLLAAAVVPLVVLTLVRAIRGRFAEHARIARVTFPIWLYVSITGVVVYLMLYQLDGRWLGTSP
jgi:protein SCO1/2/putative membrane protein